MAFVLLSIVKLIVIVSICDAFHLQGSGNLGIDIDNGMHSGRVIRRFARPLPRFGAHRPSALSKSNARAAVEKASSRAKDPASNLKPASKPANPAVNSKPASIPSNRSANPTPGKPGNASSKSQTTNLPSGKPGSSTSKVSSTKNKPGGDATKPGGTTAGNRAVPGPVVKPGATTTKSTLGATGATEHRAPHKHMTLASMRKANTGRGRPPLPPGMTRMTATWDTNAKAWKQASLPSGVPAGTQKEAGTDSTMRKYIAQAKVRESNAPKNDMDRLNAARKVKHLTDDTDTMNMRYSSEKSMQDKALQNGMKSLDNIKGKTTAAIGQENQSFKTVQDKFSKDLSRARSDLAGARTAAQKEQANKAIAHAQAALKNAPSEHKASLERINKAALNQMATSRSNLVGDMSKAHGANFNAQNEAKGKDVGDQIGDAVGGMAEIMSNFVPGVGEIGATVNAVTRIGLTAGKIGATAAKVGTTVGTVGAAAGKVGTAAASKVGTVAGKVGTSAASKLGMTTGKVGSEAGSVAGKVVTESAGSASKQFMKQVGKQAGKEIKKEVKSQVKDQVKDTIKNQVMGSLQDQQSQPQPGPDLSPDKKNPIKETKAQLDASQQNNDAAVAALDAQIKNNEDAFKQSKRSLDGVLELYMLRKRVRSS